MQDRRGDIRRLSDMLAAMKRIRVYTESGHDVFISSDVTQDAVVRNLEILGEAAGKVSQIVRSAHPEVPWAKMRGFASFAKHEYWRVEGSRLWAAASEMHGLESAVSKVRADRARVRDGKK